MGCADYRYASMCWIVSLTQQPKMDWLFWCENHHRRHSASLEKAIHPAKSEGPAIHDGGALCIITSVADSTVRSGWGQ
jgi:hypothetical protein